MTDEAEGVPTHSAAWHWERAEKLLADDYIVMAQVHATLAQAGATILAADPHSRVRSELANHARGLGVRDP